MFSSTFSSGAARIFTFPKPLIDVAQGSRRHERSSSHWRVVDFIDISQSPPLSRRTLWEEPPRQTLPMRPTIQKSDSLMDQFCMI
jgi:hypothetical protein